MVFEGSGVVVAADCGGGSGADHIAAVGGPNPSQGSLCQLDM